MEFTKPITQGPAFVNPAAAKFLSAHSSASQGKIEQQMVNMVTGGYIKTQSSSPAASRLTHAALLTMANHASHVSEMSKNIKLGLVVASILNRSMRQRIQVDKIIFSLALEALCHEFYQGDHRWSPTIEEKESKEKFYNTIFNNFLDNLNENEFKCLCEQLGNNPILAVNNSEFPYKFEKRLAGLLFLENLWSGYPMRLYELFTQYDSTIQAFFPTAHVTEQGKNIFLRLLAICHGKNLRDQLTRLIDAKHVKGVDIFIKALGLVELPEDDQIKICLSDFSLESQELEDDFDRANRVCTIDSMKIMLMKGIKTGNKEMMSLLIEGCIKSATSISDKTILSAIFFYAISHLIKTLPSDPTAEQNMLSIMEALIHAEPSVVNFKSPITRKNPIERTLLIQATLQGNVAAVRLLLVEGAEPRLRDRYGQTALLLLNESEIGRKEKESTPKIRQLLEGAMISGKKAADRVVIHVEKENTE